MTALRLLFMGTPEFALPTLHALATGPDEIAMVVTRPDRPTGRSRKMASPPVKALSDELRLPVYQPERLRTTEAWQTISAVRPDLCIVVAYGQILGPRYLALPTHGCLNLHASLLPRWRGAAPINWAVWAGDEQTGVCVMRMEQGLDTGPVLRSASTPIAPTETAGELHDRLAPIGAELMAQVVAALRAGERLTATPQDDAKATYARMLSKEDGRLSFATAPGEFVAHVHAMTPWPGATCMTPDGALRLLRTEVASEAANTEPPGTIVRADSLHGVEIAVKGGTVQLLECQRPGKRALDAREFVLGVQGSIEGEQWT